MWLYTQGIRNCFSLALQNISGLLSFQKYLNRSASGPFSPLRGTMASIQVHRLVQLLLLPFYSIQYSILISAHHSSPAFINPRRIQIPVERFVIWLHRLPLPFGGPVTQPLQFEHPLTFLVLDPLSSILFSVILDNMEDSIIMQLCVQTVIHQICNPTVFHNFIQR